MEEKVGKSALLIEEAYSVIILGLTELKEDGGPNFPEARDSYVYRYSEAT